MEGNDHQRIGDITNNQEFSDTKGNKLFGLSHKTSAILVVLLFIISLGSVLFVLFSGQNRKDDVSITIPQQPAPTIQTPTAVPTPQKLLADIKETLGWNTYSNSQYGYSIKYPLDWSAAPTEQDDPSILDFVVFNPLSATDSAQLSVTLTYTSRSYKEFLDSDPQPGETVLISTISAVRKLKEDSQRNVLISFTIPHKSNTMILLAEEKYKEIFEKMLPTLILNP